MKRMGLPAVLTAALAVCLTVCFSANGAGAAGEDAGVIREQMTTVVDPNAKLIVAIGAEVDPSNTSTQASDARWAQAADAAAQLKDAARVLQRRGVAMDRGLWMSDAKLLGAAGAAAERAAVAHNGMDFAAAASTLGNVCGNCHDRYAGKSGG